MGRINTTFYGKRPRWTKKKVVQYAESWAVILGKLGVMKRKCAKRQNLIVHKPKFETDASAPGYRVVIDIEWSRFNSDFTRKSRSLKFLASVKGEMHDLIGSEYFPELAEVEGALGVWPKVLDGTFTARAKAKVAKKKRVHRRAHKKGQQ